MRNAAPTSGSTCFHPRARYAQQMAAPADPVRIADSRLSGRLVMDHDILSYRMIARAFDGEPEGLSRDDVLDNITIPG